MISDAAMPASLELLRLRLADVAHFRIRDVAKASPGLRVPSPKLSRRMCALQSQIATETQDAHDRSRLAEHMSRGLVAFLTREYQYIHLGSGRQAAITRLYSRFLDEFRLALGSDACDQEVPAQAAAAISRHHDQLSLLVRAGLEEARALARVLDDHSGPVCATYSPALQLEILGLNPDRMAGPILDLGCGPEGGLVTYLRGKGRRDVFGVDHIATEAEGVLRASWFEAPLQLKTWGTIIAHQSFSLHFAHAHLRSEERAKAYAEAYMRTLESLKPGGCFAYAPGLPFLEPLLSDVRWLVRAEPLSRLGLPFPMDFTSTVVFRKA